jgi:hypothetical protein
LVAWAAPLRPSAQGGSWWLRSPIWGAQTLPLLLLVSVAMVVLVLIVVVVVMLAA